MGRKILAVGAGLVAGLAAMMVVNFISVTQYPIPTVIDPTDRVAMAAYIADVPMGAKLLVLFGWMLSSFIAGLVAARIAPSGSGRTMAIIAGGFLMLGGIINIAMIPHPTWMTIIGLLQYIPLAYLGGKASRRI